MGKAIWGGEVIRIYYGREPGGEFQSLDTLLLAYLRANNWDWKRSCGGMLFNLLPHKTYHTINPLIVNYIDDEAARAIVWIIDEHGEHIRMGDDESMLTKLRAMLPGEVVADDSRSFG